MNANQFYKQKAARLERFIVCQNPACGKVKTVRSPYEQRTIRFCSLKCSATIAGGLVNNPEARRRGSLRSAALRRQRSAERLATLSKVEIMRLAYSQGWKAGARSVRRRMQGVA